MRETKGLFEVHTITKEELKRKKELPWYEDTIAPHLEFILVPVVLLLGYKSKHKHALSLPQKEAFLYELFKPLKSVSKELVIREITAYLSAESAWIKKDPSKRMNGANRITPYEFKELLANGAYELLRRQLSLHSLKKALRASLPKSTPPIKFSRVGRYAVNGLSDEKWYHETNKDIVHLFSNFEPELIASLLSITSIRETVDTNAVKFFKVLHQFFENKIYTVMIGKKGSKKAVQSMFRGVVDASIVHLQSLKEGKPLVDLSKRNAPKIRRFAAAMLSYIEAIVVDIWIMRAFDCDRQYEYKDSMRSRSPNRTSYKAIEWYYQVCAELCSIEPRSMCAMTWSGIRQERNTKSTRYTDTLKKKLDHGLFKKQYGKLISIPNKGIQFEEL